MKYYLLGLLLLASCGPQQVQVIRGVDGKDGAQGVQGEKGDTGANGSNGTSCTAATLFPNETAPNGGALITCGNTTALLLNGTNGANGTNGSNGTNGHDGSNGTNGTNGSNGTPGTVITPIQFCNGTGSYPSTFPEIGFCINDKLYAVYSANGGFLTEVLPGTWQSNGIGNSCTFTVHAHCIVSH